jgi:uncharacterized membrane protein
MRPRTILTIALLAGVTMGPRCAGTRSPDAARTAGSHPAALTMASEPGPAPAADAIRPSSGADDAFLATVRPILATRCAPCHNPDGKMYARMPFDDPQVVSSHAQGILRRLNGDDRAAMEKWLAGLATAGGPR